MMISEGRPGTDSVFSLYEGKLVMDQDLLFRTNI